MTRTMRACVLVLCTSILVQASNIRFYLFSRSNRNLQQIHNSDSIRNNVPIQFIIHGWSENRTTRWYEPLTNALLDRSDCDVIQVEYSNVAHLIYPLAVLMAPVVGRELADFIIRLAKKNENILENIHIIGHSLGGQIAGYTGSHVFSKTGEKISKITALDPAGPLFEDLVNVNRKTLSREDADVVVVIHTDRLLFGTSATCGTVDIFPNGGYGVQPGCPEKNDNLFCSHHRSYWYYISALAHPGSLIAVKCDNYRDFRNALCQDNNAIDIGGEIKAEDEGIYYLQISAQRPFKVVS